MKILFSSHEFWPGVGGIETASAALATEFARSGHHVRIVTQTPGPDMRDSPFEIIRNPGAADLFRMVRWCDLFFHNNISLKCAWPLLVIRRPWVVTHQTWIARLDRSLGWRDRLKRFLLRFCTSISISRAMAADLPVPSVVIGNPYRDEIFKLREGSGNPKELVYLGRLVSDKGVDVLLRALGLLSGQGLTPNLTIIGSGPEEPALRLLARELGLSDQIEFAGPQTEIRLAELLSRHKIMVVPSRFAEPFGIVALEGIACGCAVVGSEGGGLPDAIGPCGLTFPNGDAAALAAALKRLLTDDKLLGGLLAGAAAHLAKHTARAVADAYMVVFERTVGGDAPRPVGGEKTAMPAVGGGAPSIGKKLLIYVPQMAAYGGMERHICLLARQCAKEGFQVTLITTSNSLHPHIRQELLDCGIRMVELPIARGKASILVKFRWLLFKALRLRFSRWEVLYTNGQSALVPFMWIAAGRGTRIIHHHHTAASAVERSGWHPLYRKTLMWAPEVVACSEATKIGIEEECRRSDVLFLPYITPSLARTADIVDKRYSPDSILHFGFFGRLSLSKGLEVICEISVALADSGIRWHIYGEGEEYPGSYFAKYPAVTYHGLCMDGREYAKALDSMDAVALFSRHSEGMPLSLIEAMSFGLPWIATDRGGTGEMALSRQNCVVVPPDAPMSEMKSLTAELAARIRAGKTSRVEQRRVYDTRFAPEKTGSQWAAFLSSRPPRVDLIDRQTR